MESPTKTIRPLELHSPSNSNIDDNTPSPNDGKGSAMKGTTPSSSLVVAPLPPRLPDDDDNNENENRHTTTTNDDDEDGRYEHPFYLSPIGRMDLGTPSTAAAATGTNNDMTLETPNNNNTARREEEEVNESFPDNRDETIEIHSSANYNDNDYSNETDSLIGDLDDVLNEMNGTAAEENQDDAEENHDENEEVNNYEEEEDDNHDEEEEEEETEEERMQREIEESEALARQLMAEEAMESYAVSNNFLRDNADQFSEEDLAALQAAMAEEDPESKNNNEELAEDEEDAEGSAELSYDALLRLGERIGNVKDERWALGAQEQINRLPTLTWNAQMAVGKEENHTEVKCQVCQCDYEEGDVLRRLPCDHCFHKDCIDSWLQTKDTCALCRKSIVNFSGDVN